MPIQRDGKTYYTQEEVDTRIKASIRRNARQVAQEIVAKNKAFEETQYA